MREGVGIPENTELKQNYIKKQIKDLQPGDTILHPLYRTDGLLLIDKDRTLNEALIKIAQKHILASTTILVAAPEDKLKNVTNTVQSDSKEFIKDLNSQLNEYQSNSGQKCDIESISNIISESSFTNQLQACPYWNMLERRFESVQLSTRCRNVKTEFIDLLNKNNVFQSYYKIIKSFDDVLLIHAINVVCTSLMVGLTLEMQKEELIDLSIAALFVNIGFTELPKEEYKRFLKTQVFNNLAGEKNIEVFYRIIEDAPFLRKNNIIHGIQDYHEAYSGKGTPNHKKGEEISLFGRVLHIAHAYDSMVGGYNYTTGILPLEAIHTIYNNKEMKFDPDIINILIQRTNYFKLGQKIYLHNGEEGIIIGFENYIKHPMRPIVELKNGRKINLMKMTDL